MNSYLLGKIFQTNKMKKLIRNDKKKRLLVKNREIKQFVLKSIFKNLNLPGYIKFKALTKLSTDHNIKFKHSLISRCLVGVNKKRFNKLTVLSRHMFLRALRKGYVNGIKKASW
uniref:ribosomal protein S14 n=1 Tax=Cocconeiopsis kantsiensis TaxID=3082010 RepID=UPI003002734F